MEFEPNLTSDKKRDADKKKVGAFIKGCEFKECLSPDCLNFIGDKSQYSEIRSNQSHALEHALKLIQTSDLRISCTPYGQTLTKELEPFKDIIDFSFHQAINCEPSKLAELAKSFKTASEELIKAEIASKRAVESFFKQRKEIEFSSIAELLIKKPEIKLRLIAVLSQFLPLFWFCFEVHLFDSLKTFKSLLSNLSTDVLLSSDYFDFKTSYVVSKNCFQLSVENIQNQLTIKVMSHPNYFEDPSFNSEFKVLCNTLNFLSEINGVFKKHEIVHQKEFQNDSVVSETDVKIPLLILLRGSLPRRIEAAIAARERINPNIAEFNFLNYPFLFSIEDKYEILKLESVLTQDSEIESTLFASPFSFDSFFLRNNIYLELILRRENIIEDALNQLSSRANAKKLKKPLRVKFVGEPGVDEGGLTKEFFQLVIAQVFDPGYGMFVVKNSRFWWFDHRSMEMPLNFQLIGNLLGLALYNQSILGLNLAPAVYNKIKIASGSVSSADTLGLEELADIEPDLALTLRNTLKNDISKSEFPIFFTVSYDYFGETVIKELIPNGATIEVTNDNKKLFVEKYLDWYFHDSVKPQFEPFFRGFMSVMNSKIIKMFNGAEINLAIVGKEDFNFGELKRTTKYDDGYTVNSQTILNFWEVLSEFDEEKKKNFLKFLTGSDRVPLKGLSEINMVISRNGPSSESLPSSHTCFNHLLLPDYTTIDKLREKLLLAIQHYEGFGLF